MSFKTPLLVALLALASGLSAQEPLRIVNGRPNGRGTPGFLSPLHQPVSIYAYRVDKPCETVMIRAYSNVDEGVIKEFRVEETFVATNGNSSTTSYNVRHSGGRGPVMVHARTVPCNQPDGRFDFVVSPLGQDGAVISNVYGQRQKPTQLSVVVGKTRPDFVKPNLGLRIPKASLDGNGWLDIEGYFEPGVPQNVFFGDLPMDGYVWRVSSYDGRRISLYVGNLAPVGANPRMVVVTTEDGSASATYFLRD